MAVVYIEVPHNISDIMPYIITDKDCILSEIFQTHTCFFYDTCSLRRHANLKVPIAKKVLEYFKQQDGIIIITRCILMELASYSGILHQNYIDYIKLCAEYGIDVLVMYEEDIFDILDVCFSTNAAINDYLCWAVRLMKIPVSTITTTLEAHKNLYDTVIKGKNKDRGSVFAEFFQTVRKNKESGDNLGEEILAICLYLLSRLPGERDGKFCIITEDKGAAGKIDALFHQIAKRHQGKRITLLSTPKLAQIMFREDIVKEKEELKELLSSGTEGNVVVLGTRIYDIRNRIISMECEQLAELIIEPNGIHITF